MGHKYIMKKEGLQKTVEELRTKVVGLEAAVSTVTAPKKRRRRTAITTPPVATEAVTMQVEELFPEG